MSQQNRQKEPFLWALFSSGGMAAALLLPALVFVLFLAAPLGWFGPAGHEELIRVVGHPLVRLALFGLVTVCAFHASHRGRYTLYDGMQLYHLNALIAVLTYGVAILVTGAAAYVFWTLG
jgi:fumarate reductase subunit D